MDQSMQEAFKKLQLLQETADRLNREIITLQREISLHAKAADNYHDTQRALDAMSDTEVRSNLLTWHEMKSHDEQYRRTYSGSR